MVQEQANMFKHGAEASNEQHFRLYHAVMEYTNISSKNQWNLQNAIVIEMEVVYLTLHRDQTPDA